MPRDLAVALVGCGQIADAHLQALWKPLRDSDERATREIGWQPRTPAAEAFDRTTAALPSDTRATGRC